MTKQIHFVAGLPRSGSTLLCNVLNQNPKFHATPTSGILDILLAIRNQWENVTAFKAAPNDGGKEAVMKGILPSYYSTVKEPIIFDKNRGWPAYIETAEFVLGSKVKMICTVRDIVDIIASFEKLYRKYAHIWQFPQEKHQIYKWQTVEDRSNLWMHSEQPIGIAYNRIRDVLHRGFNDRVLFVEFDHLTKYPDQVMPIIYNFIDEPIFKHDFNNVKQTTIENDLEHGIPNLHVIRNKIKPVVSNAKSILGEDVWNKYHNAQFWR